jgi:hypothetical protein
MFKACVNRGSCLSAFRGVGFRVERHVVCSKLRLRMLGKRLSGRSNFDARTVIARAMRLKRFYRHGFPRQTTRGEAAKGRRLPPVCRNVPGFGRMTSWVRAAFAHHPDMRPKRFNGRRFSSRSDSAITILPQAMRRSLAKKAPLAERLSCLNSRCWRRVARMSEAISGFARRPACRHRARIRATRWLMRATATSHSE